MRSVERRFKNISQKNPFWSSYVCFAESIKNQNFSRDIISVWFYKLVEKSDYSRKGVQTILSNLYAPTKTLEERVLKR